MPAEKVIHPAQYKRAATVVYVTKKDGSLRLCVGYREFIVVVVMNSYLWSLMVECIDFLEDPTVFLTLEANSS